MTTLDARTMILTAGVLAMAWGCNAEVVSGGDDGESDPGENVDPPGPPNLATEGCGVGVIASGLTRPRYLALAGNHVVVATAPAELNATLLPGDGELVSVAIDGSSTSVLASGLGFLASIAVLGGDVFVASIDDPVRRVSLAGGAVTPLAGESLPGWELQAAGGKLYFGTGDYRGTAPPSNDGGGIYAFDPTTSVIETMVDRPVSGGFSSLAANGSTLYFVRETSDVDGKNFVELVERTMASGNETVLASGHDLLVSNLSVTPDRLLYVTIHEGVDHQTSKIHERESGNPATWQEIDWNEIAHSPVGTSTSTFWSSWPNLDSAPRSIQRLDRVTGIVESALAQSRDIQVIACPGGVCWADPDAGTVSRWVECSN